MTVHAAWQQHCHCRDAFPRGAGAPPQAASRPVRTPAGHRPIGRAKPGKPGDCPQDQAADNNRGKQGADQGRRIGKEQGHKFRHCTPNRFHVPSHLDQDERAKAIVQIEEQRKCPGVPDKGSEKTGQKIAARQIGQHHANQKMQPQKRRERHSDAPGSADRDRQRRSRHPLDPLDDIGKQPPEATSWPQNAANAVHPRHGIATFEHGGIRPSGYRL